MTARALRAGLIGLGAMGRHHARALADIPGVDLVGIADPNAENGDAPAPVLRDTDSLLALGIDYAVIACPTRLHEPVALRLAAAGIPALIEKPVAATTADARRVTDAFTRATLPAAVGHIERFNPALLALHDLLATGRYGQLLQVTSRREAPAARPSDTGVLLDLAVHDLDNTAWITGQPYRGITACTASTAGTGTEDLAIITGELLNGALAAHAVNRLPPRRERTTTVLTERAGITADTAAATLTIVGSRTGRTIEVTGADALRSEHLAFCDLVLTGRHGRLATLQDATVALAHAERLGARRPTNGPDSVPVTPVCTISGEAQVEGEEVHPPEGGNVRRPALAEVRVKAALHDQPVRVTAAEADGSSWHAVVPVDCSVTTLDQPHPESARPAMPRNQVPAPAAAPA
ncbi:Gfo/Idh/MocA family oxidoreductase [Kitasatospora sp. NPDC127116]|uniref:Gfo/Idh/MocA family oxidoreductase n=1 Tax=Kitasatospora sp. NPDC127116 TaxID=3345367 RepID=UPI00362D6A50